MSKGKKKPWDENWQILRTLGGGGQGDAFLVKRRDDQGKEYVLKVLKNQKDVERRQRMHREVQALQRQREVLLRGVHTRWARSPSYGQRRQLSERWAGRLMQNLSFVIRPFTSARTKGRGAPPRP
jgi:hypothetical protein